MPNFSEETGNETGGAVQGSLGIHNRIRKSRYIDGGIEEPLEKETDLDVREIKELVEENEMDKAREALDYLREKYSEYEETMERLEELDSKKSSLATKLADEEINKNSYEDATQSIKKEKADLEDC